MTRYWAVDGSIPENDRDQPNRGLSTLEEAIGYHFARPETVVQALTHPSYAYENPGDGVLDNQRLEYLGDAVLGLIIAKALYLRYPELPEGRLSRMKAALVCEDTLCEMAMGLDLGELVLLGKGERATGGASKPSILSDSFEALLAAVFLDGGYQPVETLVLRLFENRFEEAYRGRLVSDHKTLLQEWVQARGQPPPEYIVTDRCGPAHDLLFTVEVKVDGAPLATGIGPSKKEAEQVAAAQALGLLRHREEGPDETATRDPDSS